MPLLQLVKITKRFGGVRALKEVSFDVQAGEVHALLGENGAGKSTLIKVITGAHQADTGTIQIENQILSRLTPAVAHQLGIACIYQQPALFPDLSVAENIALRLEKPHAFRRIDWDQRLHRAKELLERIGAAINPATEVRHLSMPEQQLVEIACAVGAAARIVIMDEPTASLTHAEQDILFGVVRELAGCGAGIIYISHRLEEIFAMANRVTVLRDGESVGSFSLKPKGISRPAEAAPAGTAEPAPDQNSALPTITERELIKLMVGREVWNVRPTAADAGGEVVLSVKDLHCEAAGIRNVSIDVRRGEIVGLAGLVGAGRTELAHVLFGVTPADGGEILLAGRPVAIRSPAEAIHCGIGYVPEDRRRHGVILEMPIAANITMAIHPAIFPATWLRSGPEQKLALEYLRALDIKASGPNAPGKSLSGGNQQKVAVARWLATKPKLLILDEPTQGVDVGAKAEIHKIIRGLAAKGLAVLLISSDLPEVLAMSDRIAVMRGGTIVATLPGQSPAHEVIAAALGQIGSSGRAGADR